MAGVFEQLRRPQVAGDQHRVLGQVAVARPLARQDAQQPVGEVLQVVEPVAQIGVARLGETGAVLAAHALHRRLGGQARAHRVLQPPVPAAVVGEHAVGLEHLVRRPAQAVLAFQHLVDLGLAGRPGAVCSRVSSASGSSASNRSGATGASCSTACAHGQAVGEPRALDPLRPARRNLDILELGQAHQLAAGDHLGQHHGDDLQVLDLVLVVDPRRPVLNDEHADGAAAAQQRHAEEGMERVFAGLRPVGEVRVAGRVRQVQRRAAAGDLADQALARAHAGGVHRLAVQALGGEQLLLARGPAQVDGADLRDHRAGDDRDDQVEPGLGGRRRRHRFANLAKERPRPPRRQAALHDQAAS